MSMRDASNSRTICEVLREINDLHQGNSKIDLATRIKLAECETMAKKMSNKLLQYNREIFSDFWNENPDILEDTLKRMNENYLATENEEWKKLRKYADTIPSLGCGGITVAEDLIRYASEVRPRDNILEFGPFLGSASAYIILGVMKRERREITLHSYDLWVIDETYSHRSEKYCNVNLPIGEDMLDYYRSYLRPLHASSLNCLSHAMNKKSIHEIKWNAGNIAMIVDDIGSGKLSTDYYMSTLSKFFIPRETIIFMMDFYFYETHEGGVRSYQKRFMEKNAHVFKFISRPKKSRCAIFKYLGGWDIIDYSVEE